MSESVPPTNIIAQLQRDEGLRLLPYRDKAGKLTIGYGRNLDAEGISRAEADYMLQSDVINFGTTLKKVLPWFEHLDLARQGVLINMAFNMGIGGLLSFKQFLSLMAIGKFKEAADDLATNTKWISQVGDRARRLVLQTRTGDWQ